jgi:hypothetical protein
MQPSFLHLDAAETVFFLQQLKEIEGRAFATKYAELKGRKMVPTKSVSEGTEVYEYRMMDKRGTPAPMVDMSDDLPMVNTFGSYFTIKLRSEGLGFYYTRDEIAAAAKAGVPLETDRSDACRERLAQYIDDVCATGDSAFGLKGLFNLANTLTYTTPAGASTFKAWSTKTPDEILADLNGMIRKVVTDTKEVERPTRIILPTELDERISTTPRQSASDTTIKKFFQLTNPSVEIVSWEKAAGQGTGGSNRVVAYDPRPENVSLLMAIEYQQLAPQERNFAYVVNARVKTGGVFARYPKSIIYGDEM